MFFSEISEKNIYCWNIYCWIYAKSRGRNACFPARWGMISFSDIRAAHHQARSCHQAMPDCKHIVVTIGEICCSLSELRKKAEYPKGSFFLGGMRTMGPQARYFHQKKRIRTKPLRYDVRAHLDKNKKDLQKAPPSGSM